MSEKLASIRKKNSGNATPSEYHVVYPVIGTPVVLQLPDVPKYVSICVPQAGCNMASYTLGNTGLTLITGYGNMGLYGVVDMSTDGKTMTINQAWSANYPHYITISY